MLRALAPAALALALATSCSPASPGAPATPAPPPVTPAPLASVDPPPVGSTRAAVLAPVGSSWISMGAPGDLTLLETAIQRWSPASQCPDFDYFPEGGIQNFWCHRPESLTLAAVRALAGVDLFASGPHSAAALRLDAPASFGHYNPAFVRWLVDHAAPSPRDSAARRATQDSYDASLLPLATILWKTQAKIRREEACFLRERSLYAAAVAGRRLPAQYHERWFFFMNPEFCARSARGLAGGNTDNYYFDHGLDGGINGNVVKAAVGFWIRRSLDGTMPTFVEGLTKLIASYQPVLLDP